MGTHNKTEKRHLSLKYKQHWIQIVGEGYNATFTYEKAKAFLDDFIALELSAQCDNFDLAVAYYDEADKHLGTAHLVAVENKTSKNNEFELMPNMGLLKHTASTEDLFLSGITPVTVNSERTKARVFPAANLTDITVGGRLCYLSSIEYDLYADGSQASRLAENEALTRLLANLKAKVVALPHVLCVFNAENGTLNPINGYKNSLHPTMPFSNSRYIGHKKCINHPRFIQELEACKYPEHWADNLKLFSAKQPHSINPLINSSPTFLLEDLAFLDRDETLLAARAIKDHAVVLLAEHIGLGSPHDHVTKMLDVLLADAHRHEMPLIFEAALKALNDDADPVGRASQMTAVFLLNKSSSIDDVMAHC